MSGLIRHKYLRPMSLKKCAEALAKRVEHIPSQHEAVSFISVVVERAIAAEGARIRRELLEDLPALVAQVLMVNGGGEKAERLVLEGADRSDLGGWCRAAIEDAARGALRSTLDRVVPGEG